jgi:hypothetical protein
VITVSNVPLRLTTSPTHGEGTLRVIGIDWSTLSASTGDVKIASAAMRHIIKVVFFIISVLVLAFFDLSSLRTHFWPFTEVVRKIRVEVTRKLANGVPKIPPTSKATARWDGVIKTHEHAGTSMTRDY